ncbi:MAG: translocation/assembly module TamB domain-containing protein [Pseudomonadota bacterium]
MQQTWPSLRLWRRIAIGAFVAIVAIAIILRLFAMSPMARNMVESRVEAMTLRGQSLQIDGLSGDLLGRLRVDRLRVRDANGVWLDANDVTLDWSPVSYLSQHIHVREVSSARMNLFRRPILTASKSQGGGIQRFNLDAFAVSDLSLGDGVAGPAQSYSLSAQIRTHRRTGTLALELAPQTHSGDRITAALDWGGAIPLRGEMNVYGAPSGQIATLAQAPEGEPISADLTAQGSLFNWQIEVRGSVGDTPIIDLDLGRQSSAYQAQGRLALDGLGIFAPLRDRLGSQVQFNSSVSANQDVFATLEAGTLSAQASGELIWLQNGVLIEQLSSQISRADAIALTGLTRLNLTEFALDGALTLTDQEQIFDGQIAIPRLTYGIYTGTNLATDGRLRLTEASMDIEATMSVDQLAGFPASLAPFLAGPATANVTARYDRNDRALRVMDSALATRALDATLQGALELAGGLALVGTLSSPALPYISDINGSWALTGPSPDEMRLNFDGDVNADRDLETVFALIGNDAQLSLSMLVQPEKLSLEAASLTATSLRATATGQLADGRLLGRSQIDAASLSAQSVSLENLDADITVSGVAAAPRLQLAAEIASLDYAGQTLTDLAITTSARVGGENAYAMAASAIYQNEPLDLDLSGRRATDALTIDRLGATWGTLTANGAGEIALDTPSASQIDLNIAGTISDLAEIDAEISYQDELLAGHINLQQTAFGPLALDQASAYLSGRWPRFTGELTYQAELETPGGKQSLTGAHGVHADIMAQSFELDGAATLADQTLAFAAPLIVNLESGLKASGQILGFGGHADIYLEPLQTGQSSIRVSNIAVQKLGPLLNRPALLGRLDAEAMVGLTNGKLIGTAHGTIAGLTRGVSDAFATDLILDAVLDSDSLTATLKTEGADQDLDFVARATAQVQHSGTLLSIRHASGTAIPVSISGDGPIEPLWAIAAPTDLRVEGDARVDIDNGTGDSWRFRGPLQLEDGVFEDGITGIHLTDISIDAVLRPDGIDVQSARAAGRRSGYVNASGSYKFDGSGSVTLDLNRLNALNRSDVSATVSGSAEIDRQNRRTSISGNLEIDEARIDLEKLPRAGYTTLDVVFTDQVDENAETAPAREAIALRMTVSGDRRIFVTGSGIDTEWGLTARVTGSPGRPNINGRATLIRGEADLLSRRFRFSEGQIRFVGDPRESQLLIRADRTNDEVTSTITLSGSLMDPEIALSSDPSLPDDEILSRVLFGRSPSELSPLQAAQLAGAAAQLAGGNALNLVGQLQEATGLDRLDIGLDDTGAATLSTGKYLSDDIYLEIESGVSGAPGVALEWTPLENVAVDAEIDPELGPKVAIQWKRDFDRLPGEPDSE